MDKKGAIVSGVLGVAAMVALMGVFVKISRPYVTIAEARQNPGDGLHVAGEVVKDTLVQDLRHNQIRFEMKDADGQLMNVVYTGAPMGGISTATKVVAVGTMKKDAFYCDQMLLKCPSKYEAAKPTL